VQRLYWPELDGLRFVAFILVLLHHTPFTAGAPPILSKIHEFGWAGVDIFLVLSGYLLASLALVERDRTGHFAVRRFYFRRILRIWPLYFFALSVGFLIYPGVIFLLGNPMPETGWHDHALPYALFLGNFSYAALWDSLWLYRSLWTVSLEEQFYLLFPLILLAPRRYMAVFCVAVLLVVPFVRLYFQLASVPYPWVWVSPITRFDAFAAGIGFALLAPHIRVSYAPWLFAIAIGLFYLVTSFPNIGKTWHTSWQLSATLLASGCLLLAARDFTPLRTVLSWDPVRRLGVISFGLYVYHRYALDIYDRCIGFDTNQSTASWLAMTFSIFFITAIFATLSYRYFEAPILQLKRRYEIVASRPVFGLAEPAKSQERSGQSYQQNLGQLGQSVHLQRLATVPPAKPRHLTA
jgi:peptidoglycan/LPS O-acetylase OafA/YrhL